MLIQPAFQNSTSFMQYSKNWKVTLYIYIAAVDKHILFLTRSINLIYTYSTYKST